MTDEMTLIGGGAALSRPDAVIDAVFDGKTITDFAIDGELLPAAATLLLGKHIRITLPAYSSAARNVRGRALDFAHELAEAP